MARDCANEVCFNCDSVGHVARNCPEEVRCCICKQSTHRAIDCPFSWYRRPTTYHDADAPSDAAAADVDPAPAPAPADPSDNADVDPSAVPVDSVASDPEVGPDSLAEVVTPVSIPAASSVDISKDDSHLLDQSCSFAMSQLTDDSRVLAGAQSPDASLPDDDSQLASQPHPSAGGLLDSQGYLASCDESAASQSGGTVHLHSDLIVSDDEGESFYDASEPRIPADPQLSAQLARSAKAQRKKIGRRAPAKLSSADVPPLRRATAPNLITSRKHPAASAASPDPPVDASDEPRSRKNLNSNS